MHTDFWHINLLVNRLANLSLTILQKLTHAQLNLAQTMEGVSIFLEEALIVLVCQSGLENAVKTVSFLAFHYTSRWEIKSIKFGQQYKLTESLKQHLNL